GDGALDGEVNGGDALAGHEGDVGGGRQAGRRVAGLVEDVGEGHREAAGVRGRDQLLGAGLPVRLLGARRPGDGLVGDAAGGVEADDPAALEEISFPNGVCGARGCHDAILSKGPAMSGGALVRGPGQRVPSPIRSHPGPRHPEDGFSGGGSVVVQTACSRSGAAGEARPPASSSQRRSTRWTSSAPRSSVPSGTGGVSASGDSRKGRAWAPPRPPCEPICSSKASTSPPAGS